MHRLACSLSNQSCGLLLIWNGPLQIWNGTLFSKMAPWCGQVRDHSLLDKKFFPITVYSDEWWAYSQIQEKLGFQYQTVNSVNFVDPATWVHTCTQAIESYWANAKYKFKAMKGVSANSLPSYLDERMWRDRWGISTVQQPVQMHCWTVSSRLSKDPSL